MPVRGRGWYKKPYKVRWTDDKGKMRTKAFHWPGPAQREKEYLEGRGYSDVTLTQEGDTIILRSGFDR